MEHPLERTNRTEISVLLLVPCHDEPTGHRWLAEVLVHQYIKGPKSGMVENVAVRYATDWQDWEVVMDHQYLEEDGKQWVRVHLEEGAGRPGNK
jgi:response regulator RpfG family c-di-GMP phosphodiesterase